MEYINYLFSNRTFVYIFFSCLAVAGLLMLYHRPWPFGYRDPMHLMKHDYRSFTSGKSGSNRIKIQKFRAGNR